MDSLRIGLFVLFGLLPPVSCEEFNFTEPLTCYMLDGILILYGLIATALYFREKVLSIRSEPVAVSEDVEEDYQTLTKPADSDPYQVLEPTKRKKKTGRKKRSKDAVGSEVPALMTGAENVQTLH